MSKRDFIHAALGQYLNYRDALEIGKYPQDLFLALSQKGYEKLDASPFMRIQLIRYKIQLVIIDTDRKKLGRWIK